MYLSVNVNTATDLISDPIGVAIPYPFASRLAPALTVSHGSLNRRYNQ